MEEAKTILLVDSNNICWRGWYHLRNLQNSKGEDIGLELGFFNTLLRLARTYKSMDIKLVWDGELVWKKKLNPTYKLKKEKTVEETKLDYQIRAKIARLRDVCRSMCDTFYQPILEADEIAGIISLACTNHNQYIVLFSGDDDWTQLINHFCSVVKPGKFDMNELCDEKRFIKLNGFYPHNLAWFKALTGCSSDNIKGVPRIRREYVRDAVKNTNASFLEDWPKILQYFQKFYPRWHPKLIELERRLRVNFRLTNLLNLRYPCGGSLAKGGTKHVLDFCKQLKLHSLVNREEWKLFENEHLPTGEIKGVRFGKNKDGHNKYLSTGSNPHL